MRPRQAQRIGRVKQLRPCFGALLVFFVSVGGCGRHESPAAPVALPALERPAFALSVPEDQRILVPKTALVKRGGVPAVFVLREGQARLRMIKSGRTVGDRIEILSGLMGDETLILGDLQPVHDGSPIQVK